MEDNSNQTKDAPGLDLKEIRQIVDLMSKNDLSVFHLEHGSFKIKLRRGSDIEAAKDLLSKMPISAGVATVAAPYATAPAAAPVLAAPAAAPAPAAAAPVAADPVGITINSPMVGTFYRAAGPNEKLFVNVGDAVDENTVVCIIEAMKVMNEIKAEARGTIVRVLVDDSKPVQYGQPLFELK
ncbi:acetyl-CoA carboxylase biotin carboxyl carrier protein [Verrucomicrobium sp. BvORR106]|uniref:acetyl-CoA carboxylase biotin carboxyl carrier protein n=1 Tax=Verrucomicrobium sp. BvORR106 TaxID=1403819 RepID=UPI00056DA218|nr:acetyl-CoA carboxylase biotin carboxyl carrier protein [Verrucomicrobium sp. BvORR106]